MAISAEIQAYIDEQLAIRDAAIANMAGDIDNTWLIIGAILVFFMQTGFAMLEVGSVSVKNTKNILMKNLFDAVIGSIAWWIIGHGLAFGASPSGVFGTTGFFLKGEMFFESEDGKEVGLVGRNYCMWLFQWAFAATAATITSGAVAERVTFNGYVIYSTVLTVLIYPIVACSAWNSEGWISPWRETDLLNGCGLIDFAGSGVVHMTGGIAALIAAIVTGPRIGRFNPDGTSNTLPQQSAVLQSLGTLILWLGWFGFNGASTLYIVGFSGVIGKVCVNTCIAGSAGSATALIIVKLRDHIYDVGAAQNGLLAGLVAVTAGCSVVEPEGAAIIGMVGGFAMVKMSELLVAFKIDDVVDAVPCHLANGIWGVIAAGIFATPLNYGTAYYSARADKCAGFLYGGQSGSIVPSIVFLLFQLAWTGISCIILFNGINKTVGMRVQKETEEVGMDISKHGGITYPEMQLNIKKQGAKIVSEVEDIHGKQEWL